MTPIFMISTTTLFQRFKLLMLRSGLKQKDLAEKVGISEYLLSHIIIGRRRGLPYRKKIAQVLGVSEKDIWTNHE